MNQIKILKLIKLCKEYNNKVPRVTTLNIIKSYNILNKEEPTYKIYYKVHNKENIQELNNNKAIDQSITHITNALNRTKEETLKHIEDVKNAYG